MASSTRGRGNPIPPNDPIPESSATFEAPTLPGTTTTEVTAKESTVRIEKFSGGYLELDRFIAALTLKFSLDAAYYPTDERKIQYACVNLDGKAMDWFVAFRTTETWALQAGTYLGFLALLRQHFGDPQPRRSAAIKIQSLRMTNDYQAYQTEFLRLSAYLRWGDAALSDLFRMGLTPVMRLRISEHEQVYRYTHPLEEDVPFIEVLRLASECDATYRSNIPDMVEARRNRENTAARRPVTGRAGVYATPPTTGALSAHREPKKPRDLSEVTCYNCNKKGHYSPDCPEPRSTGKGGPKTS